MSKEHSHTVSEQNEKKVLIVIIFTVITMFAEIFFGYITHSMALLADGYHMGTHALALGLTFIAYILIRKYADSPSFPHGTQKIGTLTAYTSALALGLTGFWIINEAIERLIHPMTINFNEAILVAIIGLIVNGICILIMENSHHHDDEHESEKEDYNYKAAYYHILTDALTSILAIAALIAGKYFHLTYFDSVVGILGGTLILKWAFGLLKNTVAELIDMKRASD